MAPKEQDSSVTADGMTAAQAVDRIEAAARPRPHDRRLHARGAVYDARFVPTGQIAKWTTSASLTAESATVIRFSNGSAHFEADDRVRGVRGMAVKFLDGDDDGGNGDGATGGGANAVMDLVAANFRVFPSRNPEGFVDLVEALSMSSTEGGLADRAKGKLAAAGKFATILAQHPESRAALKPFISQQATASFATTRYDGLHAFALVDESGERRFFRYRLVPQLGEVELDPAHAESLAPDFLIGDLDSRLETGTVTFTVVFQFAAPGDPTHDPSQAWPEHRPLVPAGHLHVTARSPREEHWQQQVFDPTRLAPGVEPSDDTVLAFRPHAYSVSAERRLAP